MKPQTVQIVLQGEATPYWFKVNPLYRHLSTKRPKQRGRLKIFRRPLRIINIKNRVSA